MRLVDRDLGRCLLLVHYVPQADIGYAIYAIKVRLEERGKVRRKNGTAPPMELVISRAVLAAVQFAAV